MTPREGTGTKPRFRPEIHGLRGTAVLLVMLYHVWFDRVSGGVDVFLFISAFFLTGSFVRRMERGQPTAPFAYWARTFKRLLPPAVVVILGTLAAVRLLLPPSTWMPTINDAIGSLLQVENWVLINRGTDYEAALDVGTSALQHFWSLSIQGQVFLLWPLLFALCALLARATGRAPRRIVATVFGVIAMASFTWSVYSTTVQQPVAYFDTTARIWEFAAGSLLALLPETAKTGVPRMGRPRGTHRRPSAFARTLVHPRVRIALGWAGLAVLVSTGALLDVQSMFPGWIALIPLLGATGVFLAGATGSRYGADRLLSSRPFTTLGDISYGLYLVHWPLLTVTLLATGRETAGPWLGALIIVVSMLIAYVLTRLIDTPVRRWRWANAVPLRSAAVTAVVIIMGLSPVLAAQTTLERINEQAEARAYADNPGGRVLNPDYDPHPEADPDAPPLPSAATLQQDWASLPHACTGHFEPQDASVAEGCMTNEAPDGAKVMVAVGNSRLAQTAMSMVDPAEENGWRLIVLHKNSCQFIPGTMTYSGQECYDHNQAVLEYLRELQPDAALLATTIYRGNAPEHENSVLADTVPQLLEEDIPVIAARTTPRVPQDPVACLESSGNVEDCTQRLPAGHMPPQRPDAQTLSELSDRGELYPLDLLPMTCPDGTCPPIIGNVHVMFDEDHLTASYARTLGDEAARQLAEGGFTW